MEKDNEEQLLTLKKQMTLIYKRFGKSKNKRYRELLITIQKKYGTPWKKLFVSGMAVLFVYWKYEDVTLFCFQFQKDMILCFYNEKDDYFDVIPVLDFITDYPEYEDLFNWLDKFAFLIESPKVKELDYVFSLNDPYLLIEGVDSTERIRSIEKLFKYE